ncbi:MAG: hypothetical protein EXX96DRAFT_538428 [Benjaminiella poitrasii]|nr:MAG: hypothetical protein EXX96DRAFT_538428 [Benjaminiella poitrasii]
MCRDDNANLNYLINFEDYMMDSFEEFNALRGSLYTIPELNNMLVGLSETYRSILVQNVGMHMLNFKLWIIRVFKAFLNHHREQTETSVPVKTIAAQAANAVITYKSFQQAEVSTTILDSIFKCKSL